MFNIYKDVEQYDVFCVDLDNTLFNYTYAHNAALSLTMKKFNFNFDDYNVAKIEIRKRDLKANHHKKELYFKIICENTNKPFYEALKIFKYYSKKFNQNLLADSSMFRLLKTAKINNKKVIAITNFYLLQQIEKLKTTNFHKYIDYIITSEEYECEKPNKTLIDKALSFSGVDKSKVITFGDSIVDDFTRHGVDYYPYNCSKVLISITGKSGSGKSSISNILNSVWKCEIIEGDGYHKYERDHPEWSKLTHYNPEANNLLQLGLDIKNIFHNMNNIFVPIYNHANGKFETPENLNSNDLDVVVIDGLHSLYKEVTGEFVKIKIFIDNDLADEQKLKRDVYERNKNVTSVIKSIENRSEDYDKYIKIQKEYSNIIINVRKDVEVIVKNDIIFDYSSVGFEHENKEDAVIFSSTYEKINTLIFNIMMAIKNNRYSNENI